MKRLFGAGTALPAVGLVLLLYLGVVALYYHPYTFLKGDALIYAFTCSSIVEDGDLYLEDDLPFAVPDTQEKSFYALGKNGRLYPKHSPFLPILGVLFFAVFGFNGLLLMNLLMALAVVSLPAFLSGGRMPRGWRLVLAATFLQPVFLHYVYNFSPDLLAALLLVAAFTAFLHGRETLFGFFTALMVLVRPVFAIQFLLGFAAASKRVRYILGGALPLMLLALYNNVIFGAPWVTGYQRVAVRTAQGIEMQSHLDLFSFEPFRIVRIFSAYPNGFLFTSALGVWQMVLLLSPSAYNRRTYRFLVATVVWQWLFLWFYRPWESSSYGIRFLLPVSALLVFTWLLRKETGSDDREPDIQLRQSPRNGNPDLEAE